MAERTLTFRLTASPEALWPYLADTGRMNRVSGVPGAQFALAPRAGGGAVLTARTRKFGLAIEWTEEVFEWAEPEWYVALRRFSRGPILTFRGGARLEPDGTGSRVTLFFEAEPRGLLGRVVLPQLDRAGVAMQRAIEQVDAFLAGRAPAPADAPSGTADRAAVDRALAALAQAGVADDAARRLAAHVQSAPEDEVVGMRPFELADAWGAPRLPTLRTFLHATRAGLLDLQWAVRCPSCRIVRTEWGNLADLKREVHCLSCNLRYDADFASAVEVRFSAHPSVRQATHEEFCMGGPANTPHVRAQVRLQPGETRVLPLTLPAGTWRIWAPQAPGHEATLVTAETGSEKVELFFAPDAISPAAPQARAGRLTFVLRNPGPVEQIVRLETTARDDLAATGALVTSLQDFRDLFAAELLAPGAEMAIRTLTFVFTDLLGSTALYERVGSAAAYAFVRDHFALWTDVIRTHDGGVVKTMGDAILAVFTDPAQAVAAVCEAQRRTRALPGDRPVVRVGMHGGPCIAVTANETLDYFGSTLNVASRVQGQSAGDDIVLTAALADDAAVQKAIVRAGWRGVVFDTELKGIPGRFRLTRLRP